MIISLTPARTRTVLALLFAGAFIMGCAEMLAVGMIDLIAADLSVSLSAAGALVTANALGLAIGGPLLTFALTSLDRRAVLLGATGVFVLANLVPVLVPDYTLFVLARVVIGAVQGLFIAAAMVTATSIVPAERAGRAMALIIGGFATSSAVGMPLGTLLGQAAGWRGSFLGVVLIGIAVLVVGLVVLPSVAPSGEHRALGQARHAFAPRVLLVLGVSLLTFAGILAAITYLIPFLDEVTGVDGPAATAYLLIYGVATAIGSFSGGRFADANAALTLIVGAIGVTLSLAVLFLFGANALVAAVSVLGVGVFGMGTAASIQHRVVSLAGPGAPLASSLPASAVNAGIAAGAFLGGVALDVAGVSAAVLTGTGLAVLAVGAAWATSVIRAVPVAAASDRVQVAD